MKFFWLGLACVALGLLSFVINVPYSQRQTFRSGGVGLGSPPTEERPMPAAIGGTMIVGGLALMIAGCRERRY
ncbi:MAG TPA: hypothetical protein VJ453_13970 [Terriglobales bacterium]|nr:hypothetical protein [Terriglobales bacterium]